MRILQWAVLWFFMLAAAGVQAGSFTSYPTTTDTDGNYSLAWNLNGSGTVLAFWVKEYKNGTFTSDVATSGTSTALSGRNTGSYRYDLVVRRRVFDAGMGEWRIVTNTEHSVTVSVSVALPAPGQPTSPASNTTGSFSVNWVAVSGANRYVLQQRKDSGGWGAVQDAGATSYSASGLTAGTYDYQVSACNASGCSSFSPFSRTVVTFPPTAAPSFTSGDVSTYYGSADLGVSWSTVAAATSYKVEESAGSWVQRYSGSGTSVTLYNRTPGAYVFRAQACNVAGCGPWSANKTLQVIQQSNISGSTESRGTVSLSVAGIGGYIRVKENGGLILDGHPSKSFSVNRATGTYTYEAATCTLNESSGYNCNPYGKPFTVQVMTAPGAPAWISAPATDSSQSVSVSWAAASGVVHAYKMERSFNGGAYSQLYSGTGTQSQVGLTSDGAHSFRARACNTFAGSEACSGYSNATTTIEARQPAVPTGLAVVAAGTGAFNVSWQTSAYADGYQLERQYNGGNWITVQTSPVTSANVSGLSAGSHVFRVRAYNVEQSYTSYSSYVTSSAYQVVAVPAMPGALSVPANDTDGSFNVSWAAAAGSVTGYELERQKSGSAWTLVYSGAATSASISGLGDGTYSFRVRSVNSAQGASSYSDWRVSTNVIVAHAPGVPSNIAGVPSSDDDGAFTVVWGDASGTVSGYTLEQQANGGAWVAVYTGSAKSYAVSGLADGSYQYRVFAFNQVDGFSAASGYRNSGTVTVQNRPPAPVSFVVPASNNKAEVSISWTVAGQTADYYQLEVRRNTAAWQPAYQGQLTEALVTGLENGDYTFRVRAVKDNAGVFSYSDYLVSAPMQNTITIVLDGQPVTANYGYDARGRLIAITQQANAVNYHYDDAGNRLQVESACTGSFNKSVQYAGGGALNLRSLANAEGYNGSAEPSFTVTVTQSITAPAGSNAIETGDWPAGSCLTLVINSGVAVRGGGGAGGKGGSGFGGQPGGAGAPGGHGVVLQANLVIDNSGALYGGSGGGGGGSGREELRAEVMRFGGGGGGGGWPNGPGGAGGAGPEGAGAAGLAATLTSAGAGGAGGSENAGGAGGGVGSSAGVKGQNATSSGGAGGPAGLAIKTQGFNVLHKGSGHQSGTGN